MSANYILNKKRLQTFIYNGLCKMKEKTCNTNILSKNVIEIIPLIIIIKIGAIRQTSTINVFSLTFLLNSSFFPVMP